MRMEGNTLFSQKSSKYEGSAEFVTADLSYALPATDVSVDKAPMKVPYFPVTTIKEQYAPIEFIITPDPYSYTDVKNIELLVLGRILRQDGSIIDNKDVVALCNLGFQHLFRQVEVYINGTLVMDAPFYAIMAHMTRLLSCNPIEKEDYLQNEFWFADKEPENFTPKGENDPFSPFDHRRAYTLGSRCWENWLGMCLAHLGYFPHPLRFALYYEEICQSYV